MNEILRAATAREEVLVVLDSTKDFVGLRGTSNVKFSNSRQ
jgi:hypothetical protein